jgi:hypothetical protein
MIKPIKIIGPVFDKGLLGLSKNLKTFDLNRELREEIGLEKHHLSKKMPIWTNFEQQIRGLSILQIIIFLVFFVVKIFALQEMNIKNTHIFRYRIGRTKL